MSDDVQNIIREGRRILSRGKHFPESYAICLTGPLHKEAMPFNRHKRKMKEMGLTYHLTEYDFDGEKIVAWRLDGLDDRDARGLLLAILGDMILEEEDEL